MSTTTPHANEGWWPKARLAYRDPAELLAGEPCGSPARATVETGQA